MAEIETHILHHIGGKTKPFEFQRVDAQLATGEWFRSAAEAAVAAMKAAEEVKKPKKAKSEEA